MSNFYLRGARIVGDLANASEKMLDLLRLLDQADMVVADLQNVRQPEPSVIHVDKSLPEVNRLRGELEEARHQLRAANAVLQKSKDEVEKTRSLLRDERTIDVATINPKIVDFVLEAPQVMDRGVLDMTLPGLAQVVKPLTKLHTPNQVRMLQHLGFSEFHLMQSLCFSKATEYEFKTSSQRYPIRFVNSKEAKGK